MLEGVKSLMVDAMEGVLLDHKRVIYAFIRGEIDRFEYFMFCLDTLSDTSRLGDELIKAAEAAVKEELNHG